MKRLIFIPICLLIMGGHPPPICSDVVVDTDFCLPTGSLACCFVSSLCFYITGHVSCCIEFSELRRFDEYIAGPNNFAHISKRVCLLCTNISGSCSCDTDWQIFDSDNDGDIDLRDYAFLQNHFGP